MLKEIEAGMETRLEEVVAIKAPGIKVGSHGGPLDDRVIVELARNRPAMWVVFTGLRRHQRLTRGAEHETSFRVLVTANGLEGETARRGGRGGAIIGAYDLCDLAAAALHGFRVDPMITPMEPVGVSNLLTARTSRNLLAVYGVDFTARVLWDRDVPLDLEDFETIHHESAPPGDGPAIETDLPQKPEDEPPAEEET